MSALASRLPAAWVALALTAAFLEGLALGRPHRGDTISEVVWIIRDDAWGRFLVLPLWCWLTVHLLLKTTKSKPFGWDDMAGLAVGVAWAVWESRR